MGVVKLQSHRTPPPRSLDTCDGNEQMKKTGGLVVMKRRVLLSLKWACMYSSISCRDTNEHLINVCIGNSQGSCLVFFKSRNYQDKVELVREKMVRKLYLQVESRVDELAS